MVRRSAFAARVQALQALRSSPDRASVRAQLGEALQDRNGVIVAKAAAIVAELDERPLIPELLDAYDRFFVDAAKCDPQCLAKVAVARALRDLGHTDPAPYVLGIGYIQLEPGWGGPTDTAGELRALCALGLAGSHLNVLAVLTHLADTLADPDKLVRLNGAIALDQLGQPEGALLLRLKLQLGDREADVVAQCFTSLLSLAPAESVDFVARFLDAADADVQLEAASALAQCREPRALEVLSSFWERPLLSTELRRVLLLHLGASPLPEAADLLISIVATSPLDLASTAITALAASRFRTAVHQRLAAQVEARADARLLASFRTAFGSARE
jgi:HEAT repeat protein